jgi:hypothetical protein
MHSALGDTSAEIQRMLDERWRAASPAAEKAGQVDAMFRDRTTMALTGISMQYPDATPEEVRYQLALRRHGREFADEWYAVSSDR